MSVPIERPLGIAHSLGMTLEHAHATGLDGSLDVPHAKVVVHGRREQQERVLGAPLKRRNRFFVRWNAHLDVLTGQILATIVFPPLDLFSGGVITADGMQAKCLSVDMRVGYNIIFRCTGVAVGLCLRRLTTACILGRCWTAEAALALRHIAVKLKALLLARGSMESVIVSLVIVRRHTPPLALDFVFRTRGSRVRNKWWLHLRVQTCGQMNGSESDCF